MEIVVNAAMSLDGKLASTGRQQVTISGPGDFERVDRLRADSDAIMVGVGTVLADDPSLTLKDEGLRENRVRDGRSPHPIRIVADSQLRTPIDATVLDDSAPTYLLTTVDDPDQQGRYPDGVTCLHAGKNQVDLSTACAELEAKGIASLMVEGGGELIFSLARAGLIDQLTVYVGNMLIGGRDAPTLADGDGFSDPSAFASFELTELERLDAGVLLTWIPKNT